MVFLVAAGLAAGCATRQPEPAAQLPPGVVRSYVQRFRDPNIFGLTMHRDDNRGEPSFTGANLIPPGQASMLEFRSPAASPLPVIDVATPRGKSHRMLIDTASRKSWIDWTLKEEYGVVPLGPPGFEFIPEHVPDTISGILSLAPRFDFGRLYMSSVLVYVRAAHGSFQPLSRNTRDENVRFVMGCGMLQAFEFVQIHYPHRRVILSATDPYPLVEDRILASLPIVWTEGALTVWGNIDGRQRKILIDTGGDYGLVLTEDVPEGTVRHVNMGDLVWRNLPYVSSSKAGVTDLGFPRIGSALLNNFVITIDNQRRLLHIELPEGTTPR